jgi:hypothetical protein
VPQASMKSSSSNISVNTLINGPERYRRSSEQTPGQARVYLTS